MEGGEGGNLDMKIIGVLLLLPGSVQVDDPTSGLLVGVNLQKVSYFYASCVHGCISVHAWN